MSLKSAEMNDWSQGIRAILKSSFGSSACNQTNFPTIIGPILYLKMMVSKMEFCLAELNCSIFFSMQLLIVLKKIDHFLREIVRLEISLWWFNIIHFLSHNGAVDVPIDSIGWGVAFVFDLTATTPELVGTSSSSCESARFSVSSMESFTYLTVP